MTAGESKRLERRDDGERREQSRSFQKREVQSSPGRRAIGERKYAHGMPQCRAGQQLKTN